MFIEIQQKIWDWIKKRMKLYSWNSYKTELKRKIERRIYKQKYSTCEIINTMKKMGLKKGANIFIHSGWDEFYNYKGSIKELISAILDDIGKEGTLAMPAYPLPTFSDEGIFDVKRTRTGAGMIAETFRNYPGVKRSANRKHSVCAIGPMADYLLDEHQYSLTPCDEKSPYYKLSKINAIIFSLGLSKYYVPTSLHCVESILREEIPYFSLFFQQKKIYKIKLEDGSIYNQECLVSSPDSKIYTTYKREYKIVKKYFDKLKYGREQISNLVINMYDAPYLVNRLIELGEKGIIVYIRPVPHKYLFKK
jgi:aminoglycoside 3-N-acetyltransferase